MPRRIQSSVAQYPTRILEQSKENILKLKSKNVILYKIACSVLDAAFVEAAFLEAAFVEAAFVDAASVDAAFVEAAFVEAAFVEEAFVEAAFMDAAFMDAAIADLKQIYDKANETASNSKDFQE